MSLLEPIWSILAIPVALALWRWLPPIGARRLLRIALMLLLLLALCRPALRLPRSGGTLLVIADRSDSMPSDAADLEAEIIDRLEASRGSADRLAVISFGARSAIERAPGGERFGGFVAEVGPQQSDLAGALETALTLAPLGDASRILVISDGRYTGDDPQAVAGRSALRGIAVDYRLLERPPTGDVAIERLDVPPEVSPGEGFLLTAWIKAPVGQEVEIELSRGGRVLSSGRRHVPAGSSRFTFRDRAGSPGVSSYRLEVRGAGDDPVPANNTARFLVASRGPRPLLVVTESPETGLSKLLSNGGLDVHSRRPEALRGSLDELGAYSAVLIEGVPAEQLGELAQQHLAAWVEAAGGGLMLTGGPRSFGPGGYFRSPIDPILPVSMELRQEHRKMALAMVVALDRSGSMAAPAAGGRTKMDLANLATIAVLDLLSPLDEFGVVAVDSSPHWVAPLASVEDKATTRRMILRIAAQGGGIFVYEALHAAAEQLLKARAGARHILLFADAADAENPGGYVELLNRCRAAGITVSVIGLGRPTDSDADLLRDVADLGGGRAFFTESAAELPRLFAQDTFVVSRSAFVEKETKVRFTPALFGLTAESVADAPPIGGYNLTYLRPEAQLVAVTMDDYQAPVVAAWQAGMGRALAYTPQVDGAYSGAIAGWAGLGDFLTSLARWTAGEGTGLGEEMLLAQEVRGGQLWIRLYLDPERTTDPFVRLPSVTVLHGLPGQPPITEESPLRWIDPDTLETRISLEGDEVALATVDVPSMGTQTLAPVRLPYSPEFTPAAPDRARLSLERLSSTTGGRQRLDVSRVWEEFPRLPRVIEITPWVLGAVVALLLLEILERRTALLGGIVWRRSRVTPRFEEGSPAPSSSRAQVARSELRQERPLAVTPRDPPADSPPAPDVVDALDQARRRASRRTRP